MHVAIVTDELTGTDESIDGMVEAGELQSFVTCLLLNVANLFNLNFDLPLLLNLLKGRAIYALPIGFLGHGPALGGEFRHELLQLGIGDIIHRAPGGSIRDGSVLLLKALALLLLDDVEQIPTVNIIGEIIRIRPLSVHPTAVVDALGEVKIRKLLVGMTCLLK